MKRKELRARAEAMIETLIDLLDQIDGDCDLECGGDLEPSIGYSQQLTDHGVLYLCLDLEDPQCAPKGVRRNGKRARA